MCRPIVVLLATHSGECLVLSLVVLLDNALGKAGVKYVHTVVL